MNQKENGQRSTTLTAAQLKQKLNELSKEDIIELFGETFKANKDARAFVSVKLQGEKALGVLIEEYKEKIRKEFYPARGLPKLRVTVVEKAIAEMKVVGKGTIWLFDLMVYFCEIAVQYIHENGDIFEDMGDLFTDAYEAVIQSLNEEETPDLYCKYKERVKAIVDTTGCECWGIHDSLEGSYSMLKWVDQDEEDEIANAPGIISYAAMNKWLKIPEEIRQKYIHNVWCGKCSGVTTISDFSVQLDNYGIMLQGSCSNCGHQVARVIEN
ncbi:DUF6155 family protein [Paenibacillus filicis]|uniref:DUF6155 family protein n=1 Tax=Paenibacillus gyeongsangnamensis TaxID=3388067 RepID=A0ABT4QH15_9BACL|nr:DUF6155 family protein [Paenibacillus filicis]MCZ8516140.1 DUF6155 family protein [Paenibacillus filicis]